MANQSSCALTERRALPSASYFSYLSRAEAVQVEGQAAAAVEEAGKEAGKAVQAGGCVVGDGEG